MTSWPRLTRWCRRHCRLLMFRCAAVSACLCLSRLLTASLIEADAHTDIYSHVAGLDTLNAVARCMRYDLMGDSHFIKFSAGAELCELMWCLVLGGEKNENCALDDSYYIALTVRQCVNKVPYLLVDLVTKIQWPIWLTHFSCTPVTEVMSVVVSFCLQVVCRGWLGDSPPSLTGWVLLNISVTPQSHHSLPWCYVAETDSMSRRSLCWSPALQCCLCHVHEYSYTASVISLGPDL